MFRLQRCSRRLHGGKILCLANIVMILKIPDACVSKAPGCPVMVLISRFEDPPARESAPDGGGGREAQRAARRPGRRPGGPARGGGQAGGPEAQRAAEARQAGKRPGGRVTIWAASLRRRIRTTAPLSTALRPRETTLMLHRCRPSSIDAPSMSLAESLGRGGADAGGDGGAGELVVRAGEVMVRADEVVVRAGEVIVRAGEVMVRDGVSEGKGGAVEGGAVLVRGVG